MIRDSRAASVRGMLHLATSRLEASTPGTKAAHRRYRRRNDCRRDDLAEEEAALDAAQKAVADAGEVPDVLAAGAGNVGIIPPAIGLSAAEMTPNQRALLLDSIEQRVSIQPSENVRRRMAELDAGLDRTTFAWTGTSNANTPADLTIQGPTVIIEFLSTRDNVRSGRGHYHSVYRNPALEYGGLGP